MEERLNIIKLCLSKDTMETVPVCIVEELLLYIDRLKEEKFKLTCEITMLEHKEVLKRLND